MTHGLFLIEVIDQKIKIRAFDPTTGVLHTMSGTDLDSKSVFSWLKSINSSIFWTSGL